MSTIAFALRYPGGHWVRAFCDGRVEGVPEGTWIISRVPVLLSFLQERQMSRELVQDNPRPQMLSVE
jgi:hypothetical protein